jgi:hypothetical protein
MMEPRVPLMTPRLVMVPRLVMTPGVPVMVPGVPAGEAPAGLPQAAEVAPEAVSATRRPPAHVCRSSTSP